jgi:predicted PurR-regulated permease PerM
MAEERNEPVGGEPPRRFRRARTAFGPGGWVRKSARLWGFLAFAILVVVLTRHVILPFIFALLLAYILAPVVDWMSRSPDGRKRLPRGLSIIICYIVLITFIVGFMVVLLPRLSKDAARIGREAPGLYQKLNDEWAPKVARWLEKRFPSMAPDPNVPAQQPVVADVPMPPGTAFVVTPLPDGRLAVQLSEAGIDVSPTDGGAYNITPREEVAQPVGIEDKIRAWAAKALASMQSELGDFFKFGRTLVVALIQSVFTFFLVLMVCGFILLDTSKIHNFARSLVPKGSREDYDVIIAGMNKGLSGVIRGQLLICLVNGILTYIGMVIFDVKYALILSVVAAIMSLIPIFGSILSTIPIVLAALVSGEAGVDLTRALAALAWIIGIHFLEGNFLNPKIIGDQAKMHPVLVIFALIVGESTYGLTGALLAVPAASMIQVLFIYFRNKAWKQDAQADDGPGPAAEPAET